MNEMTSNWDDFRLFLAVARNGGLAEASRATDKSAPTLGRRMLALERRMGQELFERLPRGYELTSDGRELLTKLTAIENQMLPITNATAKAAIPVVKISAGTWVTHLLCQKSALILQQNSVMLRFIAADHFLDMGRREAVIGIRNQRPHQAGLAYRRIGKVQFAVYAIDRDVKQWARVVSGTPSAQWLERNIGDDLAIEVTGPRNALDLVAAGVAKAVLPTFVGDAQLGLRRVSPPIQELDHEQWLVTHQEDRFIPEVRKTIDLVYTALKNDDG